MLFDNNAVVARQHLGAIWSSSASAAARARIERLAKQHGGTDVAEVADRIISWMRQRLTADATDSPSTVRMVRALGGRLDALVRSDASSARETGYGTVVARGRDDVMIRVRATNHRSARALIAHEVAHLLLYSDFGRLDCDLWARAERSLGEETWCNYVSRALIVPDDFLEANQPAGENLAEFAVVRIARRFRVPLEVASARLMDKVAEFSRPYAAFCLWRQYHPFDEAFLRSITKRFPEGRKLTALAPKLRSARGLKYELASSLWRGLGYDEPIRPEVGVALGGDLIGSEWTAVKATLASNPEMLLALTDPSSAGHLRPQWFLWPMRPPDAFVPLSRGRARPESAVARVYRMSGSAAGTAVESIKIGGFSAECCSQAFAHGSADSGQRYVLSAHIETREAHSAHEASQHE